MTSPDSPLSLRDGNIALLTGRANPTFARAVAQYLGIELTDALVRDFDDGEARVQVLADVRGKDVYVINHTGQPDRNQTDLELLIESIRPSADTITAIVPYFGYARQDRRDKPRVPISAVNRIRNLVNTGVDGIVLFDLHAGQLVGAFTAVKPRLRVDHLYSRPLALEWLLMQDLSRVTLASADAGGAKMVVGICQRLWDRNIPVEFGVGHKVGTSSMGIERISLLGSFDGRTCYFLDDMASSGKTANMAATAAKEGGATSVTIFVTHAILANDEVCHRIADGPIDRLVVTDTIAVTDNHRHILGGKLTVVSAVRLFAMAIRNLHENRSMSALFELEGYLAAD